LVGNEKIVAITAVPSDQEITARCQSGALINDINWSHSHEADPLSLLNRCITLHNNGHIDLFALTATPQFAALEGHSFFALQHFFVSAIPKLQTPPVLLMRTVQKLVAKGGNDLMSNAPNEAFRNWCAANPVRAQAIVAAAEQGDAMSIGFVTFALQALGDVALARSFVVKYSDERRLSGLFVLGHIKPSDVKEAEDTIGILLPFVDANHDDVTRCNALMSVLDICKQFPQLAPVFVPRAVNAATVTPSPTVLINLAQALWLHGKRFDRSSVKLSLDALRSTAPAMDGLIHKLDIALHTLLMTLNADLALDFLTDTLSPDGSGFELDQFKTAKHDLATGDRERLFKLLVRWLISGNSNLGSCAPQILTTGERAVPFDTSTAGMGLTGSDHIFLAYKTLGCLFTNDVIAASILVASLRGCDPESAKTIGELLFDPLLVNYGGKARDYLKTIKKGDAAYRPVKKALKEGDAYLKGLKIEEPIKELRPSEYQRNIEGTHVHDKMRKAQKEAEKQSVLLSLVHRSTLLYGRRSITYVRDPGNKRRPVSMDLRSFSTSFELPRMEIIDPVGLSVMLLTFRSAKRK
jgi:hypothetical protein